MTVKEHYDNHLGNFYSWFTGDFDKNKNAFKQFCVENDIKPGDSKIAIDLGAGNGIQSIALAELGFKVKAIDFNNQLIAELNSKIGNLLIETANEDIRLVSKYSALHPDVIVCCGDTLPHLDSFAEVEDLIKNCSNVLNPKGKIVLSFRDFSTELHDTNRFIPVKSDSEKILTCFLEYSEDKIRVTDLLHEYEDGKWTQKVSSYNKTRITNGLVVKYLTNNGFDVILDKTENRMISIIGLKR